jgi:hypothetical protein
MRIGICCMPVRRLYYVVQHAAFHGRRKRHKAQQDPAGRGQGRLGLERCVQLSLGLKAGPSPGSVHGCRIAAVVSPCDMAAEMTPAIPVDKGTAWCRIATILKYAGI